MQDERKEQQQRQRQLEAPWSFFGASLRDMHQNLGTSCIASLHNATIYKGLLYSVDPETKTLLLLMVTKDPREDSPVGKDGTTMIAVRHHALKDFIFDESCQVHLSVQEMDAIVKVSPLISGGIDLDGRKSALVALLKSKRIPVESQADDPIVHIMGSAHVRPPYVALSIDCANTVMRERVRAMVQELPGITRARAIEDEGSSSTLGAQ